MVNSLFICFFYLVSELDSSQSFDLSPTPFTRNFVGVCIGILSVVLVMLIVALCKWPRCLCLKQNRNNHDQTEGLTSVIQSNTSLSRPYRQRHRSQNQRLSFCDYPSNTNLPVGTTRDGLLPPSQPSYNVYRPHDVITPRVTITTLSVQPSQQLVPRLSISPQVSDSSITHSIYSMKQ